MAFFEGNDSLTPMEGVETSQPAQDMFPASEVAELQSRADMGFFSDPTSRGTVRPHGHQEFHVDTTRGKGLQHNDLTIRCQQPNSTSKVNALPSEADIDLLLSHDDDMDDLDDIL